MKEENENGKSTSVKNKKLYLYVALGCAAVLLAAAIIITSVALANRNHIQVDNSTSSSDNEQGGASGDEPVIDKPEEFSAPLATVSVLNEYGFYYNKTLNNYYVHTGVDFSAEQGSEVFAVASGTIESVYTSDVSGRDPDHDRSRQRLEVRLRIRDRERRTESGGQGGKGRRHRYGCRTQRKRIQGRSASAL